MSSNTASPSNGTRTAALLLWSPQHLQPHKTPGHRALTRRMASTGTCLWVVSGCRVAAETLSYPSRWQGALRDGHGQQLHHVTVQMGTGSVLPMPQKLPAEVW